MKPLILFLGLLFSLPLWANISSSRHSEWSQEPLALSESVWNYSQDLAQEFPEAKVQIKASSQEWAESDEVYKELIILEQILNGELRRPDGLTLKHVRCCNPVCGEICAFTDSPGDAQVAWD